jgi:ubiquinone/menaquinone biosynthesis C-methylase UbiE
MSGDMPDLIYPRHPSPALTELRSYYDDTSCQYDERLDVLGSAEDSYRATLISNLCLQEGQVVLEVGAGTGRNLLRIAARGAQGIRFYALDLSKEMLQRCRESCETYNLSVKLCLGNAEYLPFPSDCFDAVLLAGCLNDLPDQRRAISEMVRVAKPGGRVVLIDKGFAPLLRKSSLAKKVMESNPSFASTPPLQAIPPKATYTLKWFCGAFYIIVIKKLVSSTGQSIRMVKPHRELTG